jgi:hypothetical protein
MQQPNHLYLNVPHAEKDAAKELGARWDAKLKKWFIPSGIDLVAFCDFWHNLAKTDNLCLTTTSTCPEKSQQQ